MCRLICCSSASCSAIIRSIARRRAKRGDSTNVGDVDGLPPLLRGGVAGASTFAATLAPRTLWPDGM